MNYEEEIQREISLQKEKTLIQKTLGSLFYKNYQEQNVILAGGALTSIFSDKRINDFDVFCPNKDSYRILLNMHKTQPAAEIYYGDKTATFTYKQFGGFKIQLINREEFYDLTPTQLINTFDFTINQCAYNFKSETFTYYYDFFKDLSKRVLIYNVKNNHPISSVFRVIKYKERGYTIKKKELLKILFSISKKQINSVEEAINQMDGVSAAISKSISEGYKEKSKEHFDIFEFFNFLEDWEDIAEVEITPIKDDLPF